MPVHVLTSLLFASYGFTGLLRQVLAQRRFFLTASFSPCDCVLSAVIRMNALGPDHNALLLKHFQSGDDIPWPQRYPKGSWEQRGAVMHLSKRAFTQAALNFASGHEKLPFRDGHEGGDPTQQTAFKFLGVQLRKDIVEGIMRGQPTRQIQILRQPGALGFGKHAIPV